MKRKFFTLIVVRGPRRFWIDDRPSSPFILRSSAEFVDSLLKVVHAENVQLLKNCTFELPRCSSKSTSS